MRSTIFGLLAVACLAAPMAASATIIVGGIEFADNAFATRIISTNLPPDRAFPSGSTLESAILGSDVNIFTDTSIGSYIELGFNPGALVNHAGYDLAVFDVSEDSDPFSVSLTVEGPAVSIPSGSFVSVGVNDWGFPLRVYLFELSQLLVAENVSLESIVISTPRGSVEFAAFGALSPLAEPVPEPDALALLGLGLAGIGLTRRRKA